MEYTLTQEDIDRYGFTDAIEGDKATPAELSTMGMYTAPFAPQEKRSGQISVPAPSVEAQRSESVPIADRYMSGYSALRDLGLDVGQTNEALAAMGAADAPAVTVDQSDTSQFQPAFSQMPTTATMATATPSADMLGLLSTPISQDPFEGLSKDQRRMLAFAGLRDAGAALQGTQGTAVANTLSAFRSRADMERKRQAAVSQIQARQQVLGALGAGSLPANATPEQIDAHIAKLTSILASSPEMAPYVTAEIARLNPMRERVVEQTAALKTSMRGVGAVDALLNAPNLDVISGFKGTVNEWLNEFGAAPQYANLTSYIELIGGINFLDAYQQLKGGGPISNFEAGKAEGAQSRVNAALKGSPEDLRVALLEAQSLFQEAIEQNPMYKPDGDYSDAEKAALEGARAKRGASN
jgi:hypothetical protein